MNTVRGSTCPTPGRGADQQEPDTESPEPDIDEINREFPDAEAFTCNGMYYAKLARIIVIAAAPTTTELREQVRDYFDRTGRADAGGGHPRVPGSRG
jgi:hypothetical protein